MDLVQRILVPVDFSDCSRRALAYALGLAERVDAAVDLLHVRDVGMGWAWAPFDVIAFDTSQGLLADAVGASHTLHQWVDESKQQAHVRVAGRLERGDPLHTILEVATQGPYDLIVMGTHGRTGMSLHLLGGITRKVMQRAPCAVLTVCSPPGPDPKPAQGRLAV